ncbi:four-helix bundle copper-binding protein [Paraburkholderia humisilvae]|uniref:Cysteine-rich protein YhjQ n=1 Tax=Paraburkholderia humisilvae TaxID=627669 RepID=A0A6J5FB20_9BURK|nr:hypothetical protein LMG29542_07793 [Paraburkholderia humisilvae]
MDRREALLGSGMLALSALALAGRASAEEGTHMLHDGGRYTTLAKAAASCVSTGQVCMRHCLDLMASGNTEFAACSKSVSQMLTLCTALQGLANQDSHYVPDLVKVATNACNDCEQSCEKHADKHEPCKACMESCRACVKACREFGV